jgi:catechol 2,3-dioxygenase-like lactoylglutathione lyase family enzyme
LVKVQQLGHVVLKVRERGRSERFYTEVLGLRIAARRDTPPMTFFTLGNHHDFAIVALGPGTPDSPANSPGLYQVRPSRGKQAPIFVIISSCVRNGSAAAFQLANVERVLIRTDENKASAAIPAASATGWIVWRSESRRPPASLVGSRSGSAHDTTASQQFEEPPSLRWSGACNAF